MYLKKQECNSIDFDKKISYTEHLTDWYVDYMKKSLLNNTGPQLLGLKEAFRQEMSTSEIRQNIVTFNVYFEDLTYDLISDTPTTNWFGLFANLAGIYGGSFLAILEFLEYFFYSFFIVFKFCFIEIISLFRQRKEIKL